MESMDNSLFTSAEFKTLRTLLGYSITEISRYLDIGPATARNWDRGRYNPPPGVGEEMRDLADHTDEIVARLVRHYETHPRDWPIRTPRRSCDIATAFPGVELPHYVSLDWCRIVVARVAREIPGLGVDWF